MTQEPRELTIMIIRPIRMAGEPIEDGAIVTVDRAFAVQLISAGKAEVVSAVPRDEKAKQENPVAQPKQTKRGKKPHGA